MSEIRLAVLAVLAWVAILPLPAQSSSVTVSFAATEPQAMVPRTDESDPPTGIAEQSKTCTYQGGPKSGSWACR